ncbi:hypothetical protein GCM10009749_25970 [Agromyces neolithicus]|uniref:Uncharacterized protein n=1 Tax=Agromyces neolithicus TaxID=269420 RepID=A0ABN2MBV9_9MICO
MRALKASKRVVDLVAPLGGAAGALELALLRFALASLHFTAERDTGTQEPCQDDGEGESPHSTEGRIE